MTNIFVALEYSELQGNLMRPLWLSGKLYLNPFFCHCRMQFEKKLLEAHINRQANNHTQVTHTSVSSFPYPPILSVHDEAAVEPLTLQSAGVIQ